MAPFRTYDAMRAMVGVPSSFLLHLPVEVSGKCQCQQRCAGTSQNRYVSIIQLNKSFSKLTKNPEENE